MSEELLHTPFPYLPGDIVLTSSDSWVGQAIRFGTQEPGEDPTLVQHSEVLVDTYGTSVGALGSGVVARNLRMAYERTNTQVAIFRANNISDETRAALADDAATYVGKRYGYAKILLHVVDGLLWRLIPPLSGRPMLTSLSFMESFPICSYLVGKVYARQGLFFDVPPGAASPDDIDDYVRQSKNYDCVRKLSYMGAIL